MRQGPTSSGSFFSRLLPLDLPSLARLLSPLAALAPSGARRGSRSVRGGGGIAARSLSPPLLLPALLCSRVSVGESDGRMREGGAPVWVDIPRSGRDGREQAAGV